MKFPAIVRWNESSQEWRVLKVPGETHWLEIYQPNWFEKIIIRLFLPRIFHCDFVDQIVEREELIKEEDNLVSVEVKKIKTT